MKTLKLRTTTGLGISCLAIGVVALASQSAMAGFGAVGIYDENAVNLNTVDKSSPYSAIASTGVGANSALVADVGSFTGWAASAFATGNGGVINFDNGTLDSTTSYTASFAGGTKSFLVTDNDFGGVGTLVFNGSGARTPISGAVPGGAIANSGGSQNFAFNFSGFTGFATEEKLVALGLTFMSRDGSGNSFEWTLAGTLDNGDIVAASAVVNMNNGNTLDDTFYGLVAPTGRYFVSAGLTGSQFSAYDDFVFITGDPALNPIIPEPSTVALLLGGFALLMGRQRSRKA